VRQRLPQVELRLLELQAEPPGTQGEERAAEQQHRRDRVPEGIQPGPTQQDAISDLDVVFEGIETMRYCSRSGMLSCGVWIPESITIGIDSRSSSMPT
jgi:hypothetical protein